MTDRSRKSPPPRPPPPADPNRTVNGSEAPAGTIVERYHRDAQDYARYWAPVLENAARGLLDLAQPFVARAVPPVRVLDVGAGTGRLAVAAAERWPQAEVTVSDAAAGMLDLARARAAEKGYADPRRMQFVVGAADRLPLPSGSFDLVISSFVLQLVPDRLEALREAHRLLRPAGMVAYVTWLDRDLREPFRPLEEFDEAVLDLQVEEEDEPDGEPYAGDVPSPRAAAGQLRRAGFRDVSASEDLLTYDWTRESYLEYKLAYDERALMSTLDEEQRERLARRARERLERLPEADFRWQAPIVFASGTRP
jgi:SAM-dependent methyltransferase